MVLSDAAATRSNAGTVRNRHKLRPEAQMTSKDPVYENKLSDSELAAAHFRTPPTRRFSRRWWGLGAVLLLVAATFLFGIRPRLDARADLKKETAAHNVTSVS